MKTRLFSTLVSILVLSTAIALADSYTLTLPNGYSMIANQLDNGSGNTADQLFPNPGGALDSCTIEKWNCNGGFTQYMFDSSSQTGFSDPLTGSSVPAPTLAPGEGAFFNNQTGAAITQTFSGTPIVPVLPALLPCGCGHTNLLSRQVPGIGTYENITGLTPQNGAVFMRFNGASYIIYTFTNCLWIPAVPTAAVGESVFIMVPCTTNNPCPCPPEPLPLFNTGVNSNHVVLADGAIDPHYSLTTNPNGGGSNAIVVVSPLPGGWLSNSPTSKWIGPSVTNGTGANGTYVYRMTFNLPCTDNAIIIGQWAADNSGTIRLNGSATPVAIIATTTSSSFTGWHPFAITAGLVAGQNSLEFYVTNVGAGPTGLRVELSGTTTCCPSNPCIITMTCFSNKTVSCGTNWSFDAPTNIVDACCTNFNLTVSDVTNSGPCPLVITRNWLVSDTCGKSNFCSQTVTVVDTTAPAVTTAQGANATIQCPATPVFSAPVFTDACAGVISPSVVTATNTLGCTNIVTRTWTATDTCGNSTNRSQVITVVDTTRPAVTTAQGANATIECPALPSFTAPVFTDACAGVINPSVLTVTNTLGCTNIVTRTWTATDPCGNSTNRSQVITVVDTTPPAVTTAQGANATIECPAVPSFTAPVFADLCAGVITPSAVTVTNTVGCTNIVRRTWTATDTCGNSTNRSQVITVMDTTPPVITCATNKTVACGTAWNFDAPVATDNCSGTNVTLTYTTTTNGICPQIFTRTWIATDLCGNTNTCSQIVTVTNIPLAFVSLPTGTNYGCNPATNSLPTDAGVLGLVAIAGSCSSVITNVTHLDARTNCTTYRTFTITASNVCGSAISTHIQYSWMNNTNAPVITPGFTNLTVYTCSNSALVFFSASATSACCTNVTIWALGYGGSTGGITLGHTFGLGTTTIQWQATDCCGNTATTNVTITVANPRPPVITPSFTNLTVYTCSNSALVFFGASATSAYCTNVTIFALGYGGSSGSASMGHTFGLGTTVVEWLATDCCGNTATNYVTITVANPAPPVITPSFTNLTVYTCSNSALVFFGASATSAYCTNVTIFALGYGGSSGSASMGHTFGLGTTVVEWLATDCCGNTTTNYVTVTVARGSCPEVYANKDFQNNTGQTMNGVDWLVQGTYSSVNWHYDGPYPGQTNTTFSSFTIVPSGSNTIFRWSGGASIPNGAFAHVGIGLAGTSLTTLGVNWTVGGVASGCVHQISVGSGHSHVGGGAVVFLNTATNCESQTLYVGNLRLEWFSTNVPLADLNGSAVRYPIRADDINSSLVPVSPGGSTSVTIPLPPLAANFAMIRYTVSASPTLAGPGNTIDYQEVALSWGNLLPVIYCPSNIVVTTCNSNAVVIYTATATGNCCTNVTIGYNPPSGYSFPLGTTTVSCTATDCCGFVANCSFTVTVNSCTNPCPPLPLCRDFSDNSLHGWQPDTAAPNVGVSLVSGGQGGTNDYYVRISDQPGASAVMAGSEFYGDWSCYTNNCGEFSYDYRVFSDGCPCAGSPNCTNLVGGAQQIIPRFQLVGCNGKRFTFTWTYFTVTEDGGPNPGWHRITAHLGPCAPGSLPFSSYGVWTPNVGTTAADWASVLQNVCKISISPDFSSCQSEVIGIDNVCLQSATNCGTASINKDLCNTTGQTADGLEIVMAGNYPRSTVLREGSWPYHALPDNPFFPDFSVAPSGANTILRWSGQTFHNGDCVHVGFVVPGPAAQMLAVRWTSGGAVLGCANQVRQQPWYRDGNIVVFVNDLSLCSLTVLYVGNLEVEYHLYPVDLSQLNASVTNRNPVASYQVPGIFSLPAGAATNVVVPAGPTNALWRVLVYTVSSSPTLADPGNSTDFTQSPLEPIAAVPVSDTVTIQTTSGPGGTVTIRWSSEGTLQSATAVTGPWTVVPGATSPYSVSATNARQFFRVILP